jgi:hypothetical protein
MTDSPDDPQLVFELIARRAAISDSQIEQFSLVLASASAPAPCPAARATQ